MFKRIFLFLALNFAIVLTISLLLSVFQVKPYLNAYGIDYTQLAIFCLIWGMAGAFISLLLSRKMAKWSMGVKLLSGHEANPLLQSVYDITIRLAQRAHLPEMPEVGVFQGSEPNAFATGPSKRRSLVAVSTGLLEKMDKTELEAVIGHEISHIVNGDMVTMTLLQGVINAFVMFLARALALAFSGFGRDRDGKSAGSYLSYTLFTFLFEIIFMTLGSLIVAYFSRYREYRADSGSADMLGKQPMIRALQKLEASTKHTSKAESVPESVAAFLIHRPKKRSWITLFATHPPIEDRIAKLNERF
ncbi:MAG: protease HtpX [Verrucomicrobia bacterium]|nr:protease HtpX [Verrucomicrobiota bacterium]